MLKTNYFEPTIWTEQKNQPGNIIVNRSDFEYEEDLINMHRRIERAALAQIAMINGGSPKYFSDICGILRLELNESLTDEQERSIMKIFRAYFDGIYARHQFQDARITGTKKDYARWFNYAKESYLYTMPLKQILSLSDWDQFGVYTKELENTFKLHNGYDELTKENYGLGSYSINMFKACLEGYFEPYVMLSVIGKNVHAEEFDGIPYMVCTTRGNNKLAVSFFSKEIFAINGNEVTSMGNSYEYVFKKIGLPIEMVLNSVFTAMDPYKLPGEGIGEYRKYDKLVDEVKAAVDSKGYEEARKLTKKSYYFDFI